MLLDTKKSHSCALRGCWQAAVTGMLAAAPVVANVAMSPESKAKCHAIDKKDWRDLKPAR